MEVDDERRALIRSVRQRLDALRRAGIDRIPMAPLPPLGPASRGGVGVGRARQAAAPAPRRPLADVVPSPTVAPQVAAPIPTIRLPEPPAVAPPVPPRVDRPITPPPVAASLFGEPALEPAVPAERTRPAPRSARRRGRRVHPLPRAGADPDANRLRRGQPDGTADVRGRGSRGGRRPDRSSVRGPRGGPPDRHDHQGDGPRREATFTSPTSSSRARPTTGLPPSRRSRTASRTSNGRSPTIRPQFLCLLGKTAALALLETALPLGKLRGKWHRYRTIPTIVTYHPAALLRNPAWKKETWDDLQILMQAMGIKPPDRRKPG